MDDKENLSEGPWVKDQPSVSVTVALDTADIYMKEGTAMTDNLEITEVHTQAKPGAVIYECLQELTQLSGKYHTGTTLTMIHNCTKYTIKSEHYNDR